MSDNRIPDDPRYKDAAAAIAKAEGSTALSWRVQDDGTLTVVLVRGPKINRPIDRRAGSQPAEGQTKIVGRVRNPSKIKPKS